MGGPLEGLRVLELGGIGPTPHAAMMLADMGADVVRIERPSGALDVTNGRTDWLLRGRRTVVADVKDPTDLEFVRGLVRHADVLIEGNRPGVTERLGLGPEDCRADNPGLVYARMTGWGQYGPRASTAGHDINYLSLTGGLSAIGRAGERPVPPLNLVADVAGGSMMVVVGILAALHERSRTGEGQVVDAAMVDGTSVVLQMVWSMLSTGTWKEGRGTNLLDGGCPYYDTYTCADGGHIAVGALEPAFYREFVSRLGIDTDALPDRGNPANWPALRTVFGDAVAQRSRDEWTEIFDGTDACVTPVLSFAEAVEDAHLGARRSVISPEGVPQGGRAPRFSRHADLPDPSAPESGDGLREQISRDWG